MSEEKFPASAGITSGTEPSQRSSVNPVSLALQRAREVMTSIITPRILLILVGVGWITTVLVADAIGLGAESGLGETQTALVFTGFVVLLGSVVIKPGSVQLNPRAWLIPLSLDRPDVARFLSLVAQIGLLVLVIRQFRIESQIFYDKIVILTFFGFIIHYFLPIRLRLPFFLFLSLTSIWIVFGLSNALWLVDIGLVLIVLCHFPVPFTARVVVLLIAAVLLALLRGKWDAAPWSSAIWPILASMFMFRLIIYLYDLKHQKERVSIWQRLSYFFLFPNVVFPFFPVVDFSSYRRSYYDGDQHWIYQKGVRWMSLGVAQLIVYRLVYIYGTIPPASVETLSDLARFLFTNFLLYLRISGIFHLVCGILHLFGFHLPATNNKYLLATGFTEFWRRINIYWKDFMMKVFYYPAYFRLRKWGPVAGIVLATLIVFLATWFLHSYQWFWLRGSFLLSPVDISFWMVFALLMVISSLYEARHGRARTLGTSSWSFRENAVLSLRTVGFVTFLCTLWSLWTSSSFSEWLSLWSGVKVSANDVLIVGAGLAVAILVAFVGHRVERWGIRIPGRTEAKPAFSTSVAMTGSAILLMYAVGSPVVSSRFGPTLQKVLRDIRAAGLNRQDAALLQRGYYEDLTRIERFNSQLWHLYMSKEDDWAKIFETQASRSTHDFLNHELRPYSAIYFHGAPLRTNRWGMRDQDYDRSPLPGTYRMALLGASHQMGSGVADGQTFEWLLEERLNRENDGSGPYARYEILNFAVAAYTPPQHLWVMENKVPGFEPNAIIYSAHGSDVEFAISHLAKVALAGIEIPYDFLNEVVQRAGIDQSMTMPEAEKRLQPFGMELVDWVYQGIAEESRERGVLPIWVLMGTPGITPSEEEITQLTDMAEQAGFVTLNLSHIFENQDIESLRVAEWDWHPNAKGHRIIADRLYEALRDKQEEIPLDLPTWTEGP